MLSGGKRFITERPDLSAALLSAAALFWLAVRWYRPDHVIAYVDLFPIYEPLTLLEKSFLAWSDAASPFGSFNFPTYSTLYLLYAALTGITNAGFAQILLFWSFLTSGWLGTFVLCRRLGIGIAGSFVGAWAYVLNPFAQFLVPFTTASAYSALIPWIFFLLRDAAKLPEARSRVSAVLAILSLLVLPWVGSTPQLLFEFVLSALVWSVYLAFGAKPGFVRWLAGAAVLCLIAASWWLVPVLYSMLGSTVVRSAKDTANAWVFANSSLLNNLRFITPWTWELPSYLPYSQGYDNNVLTYAASFWGAAVLSAGLLIRKTPHAGLIRFFGAVVVAAVFIAKGPHEPLAWLNSLVYRVPGFFLLIEAVGVTITALLGIGVVVAIVVDYFASGRSWQSRTIGAALAAVTIVAALFSSSPLLNGLVFSGSASSIRTYVRLPQYWKDAGQYLKSQPDFGYVLVLPQNDTYQATYDWDYEGVDVIPSELIPRSVLVMGPSLNYFSDGRLEDIKLRLSAMLLAHDPATAKTLKDLGFRYVLCRNDIAPYGVEFHFPDCNTTFLRPNASIRTFDKLVLLDLGPVPGPYRLRRSGESVADTSLLGAFHLIDVPAASNDTVVDRQFFSSTWSAIDLSHPFAPPEHARDGPFNAWLVRYGGATLVFNAINALEIALLAMAIFATSYVSLVAFRRSS